MTSVQTLSLLSLLLLLVLASCAESHEPGTLDGATHTDATATHDAGTTFADAAATHDAGTSIIDAGRVVCGPNVCRAGEICCNAACGVCAFPDECIDYGCAGWHSP